MIQSLATLRYERETGKYCSKLVTYFGISSRIDSYTLCKKCPYSEIFWMRENTDKKNSEQGHVLRSNMYNYHFNFFGMNCFPKRAVILHKPIFWEIEE